MTYRIGLLGMVSVDLGDDRRRTRLVLRRFDDDDVVALVDGDAVMAATFDVVNAIVEFLHLDVPPRRPEAAHRIRDRDLDRRIRRDFRDGDVQDRMPALRPQDPGRKRHATEVAVVGVRDLDWCIAEDRVVDPGLDALDLVLRVDVADIPVFPAHGEGDVRAATCRLRRRVVRYSRPFSTRVHGHDAWRGDCCDTRRHGGTRSTVIEPEKVISDVDAGPRAAYAGRVDRRRMREGSS